MGTQRIRVVTDGHRGAKGPIVMRDVLLEMGGYENRDFKRRSAIAAITKLLWNGFDVSATQVRVETCRTVPNAPNEIIVIDKEDGDAWRAQCVHTGT